TRAAPAPAQPAVAAPAAPVAEVPRALAGAGAACRRARAGGARARVAGAPLACDRIDRKSTRLNSSHVKISYAVFCLKKKYRTIVIRTAPCSPTYPRNPSQDNDMHR